MATKKFKAVLAMDSFKGSLSALDACKAIKQGLEQAAYAYDYEVEASFVPVSDGGEGLLKCLHPVLSHDGYQFYDFKVLSSYLAEHTAQVLVNLEQKTALIESAEVIGLELAPKTMRHPEVASTYGLGQLIKQVVALGCTTINIGLGGTGTNDCGIGMAQALGVRFWDSQGQELGINPDGSVDPLKAQDLSKVAKIDSSALNNLNIKMIGSCDVNNPLCGSNGATMIFGPQKGLQGESLNVIEQGMQHFAQVLTDYYQEDCSVIPGAGAAGGLGAALLYFFKGKVQLQPGIDMVLSLYKFEQQLKNADVVIMGEGCMDGQTAQGKAPMGIARFAHAAHVPCIALCGTVKEDASKLYDKNVTAMFSLASGPMTLEQCLQDAPQLLTRCAENVFRCLMCMRQSV